MNARVQEVFLAVADLPPGARTQYFVDHGVDAATSREVESLVAYDTGASEFLERDIGRAADRTIATLEAKAKGQRCGRYRLLNLIGRGGMGSVYLAERVDGEVTQRTAVKLLRPGSDDPHQRQRFLQERQILASLSHPHIARLFDAGHREDGQPFLAMEYVDGQPIDVFAAGLGVRQILTLFLKVCAAVSYLHRNLIVHRDLKPSNILVTADGEPKLLDFGIAKILDLNADSTMTVTRLLTPDYASPEQVAGRTMSTATDIYSLGAVLYRLLTGKSPHHFDDRSPETIVSAICTREITRPSKWVSGLKGDLEIILLKALRKEPQERYSAVEQFAEDLESFLESRPIRARKGDLAYRATKFVRRYWLPVAAASLAVMGLAAGLLLASRERNIAQRRFGEVRQLAGQLLDIDKEVRDLQGGTKARVAIVQTALGYLERLGREAGNDPELCAEIAAAYLKVAEVQGIPGGPGHIGKQDEALASLRHGEAYLTRALAVRPADAALLRNMVRNHVYQVRILEDMKDWKPAHASLTVARNYLGRLPSAPRRSIDDDEAAGLVHWTAAHMAVNQGRHEEARQEGRLAVESLRKVARARNQSEDWSALASALGSYGNASRFLGDLRAGLEAIRESRQILEQQIAAEPDKSSLKLRLSAALFREGCILGQDGVPNLGERDASIQTLTRGIAVAEEVAQRDPRDAISRTYIAMLTLALGGLWQDRQPANALRVYEEALARLEEVPATQNLRDYYRVYLEAQSTYPLRSLRRQSEVDRRLKAALDLARRMKPTPIEGMHPNGLAEVAWQAEADNEAALGRPLRAAVFYEDNLRQMDNFGARPFETLETAAHYSAMYEELSRLYRQAGDATAAQRVDAKRRELWTLWDRKLPGNPYIERQKQE